MIVADNGKNKSSSETLQVILLLFPGIWISFATILIFLEYIPVICVVLYLDSHFCSYQFEFNSVLVDRMKI